jgi:exodeoxyribonuclease VII large subunit
MSEIIRDKTVFTLSEVAKSVQKTLAERYSTPFWIKAEMNKLNYYSHSGHCYPELVEKINGRVVAQMRSTLWSDDYLNINQRFLNLLHEPLKDGIKILFQAKIKYDAQYGLSLHIMDIDPSYTLGDLELEKQLSIERLKKEGIFYQNKNHLLPLLPQRIAIISVETSKGYADFMEVIENNPYGYRFFHMLFPAILQGENAIDSINFQLSRIEKVKSHFDVVAIIRGGGGDVGLSCYNNYSLARTIALFPLPVLTGIGHATNETVCEMTSFQNAITPTKIAEFLIQKFHNFSVPLSESKVKIIRLTKQQLHEKNGLLQNTARLYKHLAIGMISENKYHLSQLSRSMMQEAGFRFRTEKNRVQNMAQSLGKDIKGILQQGAQDISTLNTTLVRGSKSRISNQQVAVQTLEKNVEILNPLHVLKRGFSITLLHGKAVRSTNELKPDDNVLTQLFDGSFESNVKKIE